MLLIQKGGKVMDVKFIFHFCEKRLFAKAVIVEQKSVVQVPTVFSSSPSVFNLINVQRLLKLDAITLAHF